MREINSYYLLNPHTGSNKNSKTKKKLLWRRPLIVTVVFVLSRMLTSRLAAKWSLSIDQLMINCLLTNPLGGSTSSIKRKRRGNLPLFTYNSKVIVEEFPEIFCDAYEGHLSCLVPWLILFTYLISSQFIFNYTFYFIVMLLMNIHIFFLIFLADPAGSKEGGPRSGAAKINFLWYIINSSYGLDHPF